MKRLFCALAAVALLFALSIPATEASGDDYYFVSLNDKLLPLSSTYMPFLLRTTRGSTLYIPITIFDSRNTGVDLGVYSGGDGNPTITLYSRSKSILFDLEQGTTTADDGQPLLCMALWRNGRVYVPANYICNYFGLTCSMLSTAYGDMVRITNGNQSLSNAQFVDAAASSMKYFLNEYTAATQPSPSPSDPTSTTPTVPTVPTVPDPEETEPLDPDSIRVSLAFRCSDPVSTGALLDQLETNGITALLLFSPDEVEEQSAQLRRAAAAGHTIGLWLKGSPSTKEALDTLEGANRLLRTICQVKSRIFYAPEGSPELMQYLSGQGWVNWDSQLTIDGAREYSGDGIYRQIDSFTGTARVTLDDHSATVSALPRLMRLLQEFAHVIHTPTESDP